MQYAVCKSDHLEANYNILRFLKLCAETAYARKFVRLPDPTVQYPPTSLRSNFRTPSASEKKVQL